MLIRFLLLFSPRDQRGVGPTGPTAALPEVPLLPADHTRAGSSLLSKINLSSYHESSSAPIMMLPSVEPSLLFLLVLF